MAPSVVQHLIRPMRYLPLLIALILIGCSSDADNGMITGPVTEEPDNQTPTVVSFSMQVQPIFAASCGGSGCHVGGSASGVNLASWSATMASNGSQYGGPSVVAGSAAISPLVDKLGSSPRFGSRMPLGRAALTSSQIASISSWINDGAPNN